MSLNNMLSDDALSVVPMFKANMALELVFNTPARIHPRMKDALSELTGNGVLKEDPLPHADKSYGLRYTVASRTKLKDLKTLSFKRLKEIALPITVD